MDRLGADLMFFAVFLALALVVIGSPFGAEGMAAEPPKEIVVPHVVLLSPDRDAEVYASEVNFLYRVNSIDYDVTCGVSIDDKIIDAVTLSPGQLGQADIKLTEGRYSWRVDCKLLNGRTITSQERFVSVNSYKELPEAFAPTGRAIFDVNPSKGKGGVIVILVMLTLLIWTVNVRRRNREIQAKK